MIRMDLYKLKYFQTVAEMEHMTKAAEKLHISQPALTKAIKHLEELSGVQLFDRKGKKIILNEYGKILYQHVNRAFLEIEEGTRIIQDKSGLKNGEIAVAVTFPHIFPKLLSQFLKDYPKVKVKQIQLSENQIINSLESQQIDFAISTVEIDHPNILWEPILKDEIFITVSKQHPLANRKILNLEDIAGEKLIGLIENYSFRTLTDQYFKMAGITPNYFIEVEESSSILQLVHQNYGVSLTPGQSLHATGDNVQAIRIRFPKCDRVIGIAYQKDHYFSKAAQVFMKFVKDNLRISNE